ncbi:MAG: TonB-dependent receptor plug domain-containing protein [Saprospiraceae bacterium]|nr:TonB-dependent receptor plug domain-containing protein [Saprospiraceae bacterium]
MNPFRILHVVVMALLAGCALSAQTDTLLPEVSVEAYEGKRLLLLTPAPLARLETKALSRFDNSSLLPALNTVAGVRMEERSPGSYRLSFRGSLLRSPFGVRNVKIYLDGFPLTDPGGGTYLNLLDVQWIDQVTLIKGPASGMYGAGTGGAMFLQSSAPMYGLHAGGAGITVGGYGQLNGNAWGAWSNNQSSSRVAYAYGHTDGYRNQSAMDRHSLVWQTRLKTSENQSWQITALLADLQYETPGGLTETQMEADPRQARPATASVPGAEEQQAAVHNQSAMLGVGNETEAGAHWLIKTYVYTRLNDFSNPAIRNYEQRQEMQGGGRSSAQWSSDVGHWQSKLTFGLEMQAGYSGIQVSDNAMGALSDLQTSDKASLLTGFVFVQEDISSNDGWVVQAGGSFNGNLLKYSRLYPVAQGEPFRGGFAPTFAPRLALLRAVGSQWSVYFQTGKGFSAPTLEEILPSNGVFNTSLMAEQGWNTELGVRFFSNNRRINAEFNAFLFRLQNAIVLRREDDGAEYFENAGSTKQDGLEAVLNAVLMQRQSFGLKLTVSGAWLPFYFTEYKLDQNDYSGNRLTGVAPLSASVVLDATLMNAGYVNFTHTYTGPLPLDDANSAFAPPSNLLSARMGWKLSLGKHVLDCFAGGNNLFNINYSLGYDLNAVGGRFYNPAAERHFFAGVRWTFGQ